MPTATAAQPRSPAFSFALAGLAWGLGLFAFLRLPWIELHGVLPVTRLQGQLAAAVSGASRLPVDVTLACSGTDVMAMCLGAILAYPARGTMRLAGAAGGVALILTLNIIRIATLGRTAGSPALFDTLHLYVWPALLALGAAAYVFAWMRAADAAPRMAARKAIAGPTRRFVLLTGVSIVIFAAASPLYLESAWVLGVAGAIARTAAAVLQFGGMAALASGNLLVTARGGVTVTQECISTPLIPVYLAAVAAYVPDWRRRVLMLLAVGPVFFALGVMRLLVVAVPGALVDSPLFFIHAFYQLLTAMVLIGAAACWRHGTAKAWRPAAVGMAGGAVALAALVPVVSRLLAAGPAFPDPQGATSLIPAFQLALFTALWIAVLAPARWTAFAVLLVALALSQAALFAAMHATGAFDLLAAHVPEVRAWSLALPVALVAVMRIHAQPRD